MAASKNLESQHIPFTNYPQPIIKKKTKTFTSETGLCDGSERWGGREPEWTDDLGGGSGAILSFLLFLIIGASSATLGEGISFISQSVAANFLAETGAAGATLPVLLPQCDGEAACKPPEARETEAGDGDRPISLHVGTGVVDPPLLPTTIALLNL